MVTGLYQGKSFSLPTNELITRTPAHSQFDLRAGYDLGPVRLIAYVRNLFDDKYVLGNRRNFANLTTYLTALAEGRTMGLGIEARF